MSKKFTFNFFTISKVLDFRSLKINKNKLRLTFGAIRWELMSIVWTNKEGIVDNVARYFSGDMGKFTSTFYLS